MEQVEREERDVSATEKTRDPNQLSSDEQPHQKAGFSVNWLFLFDQVETPKEAVALALEAGVQPITELHFLDPVEARKEAVAPEAGVQRGTSDSPLGTRLHSKTAS